MIEPNTATIEPEVPATLPNPGSSSRQYDSQIPVFNLVNGHPIKVIEPIIREQIAFESERNLNCQDDSLWQKLMSTHGFVLATALSASTAAAYGDFSVPTIDQSTHGLAHLNQSDGQFVELTEKLDSIAKLEDGWNGYKAPAPAEITFEHAHNFLRVMADRDCLPIRIAPSAVGGIAITRRIDAKKVCVEIFNNGLICALFVDDDAQTMRTQRVEGTDSSFDSLISDIEDYLDG